MRRKPFYIIALILGLALLPFHHLKYSVGDTLFTALGISPWSNGSSNTGLHFPVIIGTILLAIGITGIYRSYRSKYPRILRWLILGSIAFFLVFPSISEAAMYVVKHNAQGDDSVDVTVASCRYNINDKQTEAECTFTLFNYGKAESLTIRPIFTKQMNGLTDMKFEKNELSMDRHSKFDGTMKFQGRLPNEAGISGWSSQVEMEVEVQNKK